MFKELKQEKAAKSCSSSEHLVCDHYVFYTLNHYLSWYKVVQNHTQLPYVTVLL